MERTHIGNANWGQVFGHGLVLRVTRTVFAYVNVNVSVDGVCGLVS
jgi:hypothetical protein